MAMLKPEEQELVEKSTTPGWLNPMLATLGSHTFSDPQWIYERKLDGERALAYREGDRVRLLSRNRKDLSDTYPELVDALSRQPPTNFGVDGEVVAFSRGITSFSRLQKRMQIREPEEARRSSVAVFYYLFDILHVDSFLIDKLPLRSRKRILRRYFDFKDPLRLTAHRNEQGEHYYKEACTKGWEGLIAKDGRSAYVHSRSRKWLKLKCVQQQELVIGGYTEPGGQRKGFGALLVGYYDGNEFVYAGKVGTGYDDETLERLHEKMSRIERETSPFDRGDVQENNVNFVTPCLVAEVGFTEWTKNRRLRHPRYLGLRRDKKAREVVREESSEAE